MVFRLDFLEQPVEDVTPEALRELVGKKLQAVFEVDPTNLYVDTLEAGEVVKFRDQAREQLTAFQLGLTEAHVPQKTTKTEGRSVKTRGSAGNIYEHTVTNNADWKKEKIYTLEEIIAPPYFQECSSWTAERVVISVPNNKKLNTTALVMAAIRQDSNLRIVGNQIILSERNPNANLEAAVKLVQSELEAQGSPVSKESIKFWKLAKSTNNVDDNKRKPKELVVLEDQQATCKAAADLCGHELEVCEEDSTTYIVIPTKGKIVPQKLYEKMKGLNTEIKITYHNKQKVVIIRGSRKGLKYFCDITWPLVKSGYNLKLLFAKKIGETLEQEIDLEKEEKLTRILRSMGQSYNSMDPFIVTSLEEAPKVLKDKPPQIVIVDCGTTGAADQAVLKEKAKQESSFPGAANACEIVKHEQFLIIREISPHFREEIEGIPDTSNFAAELSEGIGHQLMEDSGDAQSMVFIVAEDKKKIVVEREGSNSDTFDPIKYLISQHGPKEDEKKPALQKTQSKKPPDRRETPLQKFETFHFSQTAIPEEVRDIVAHLPGLDYDTQDEIIVTTLEYIQECIPKSAEIATVIIDCKTMARAEAACYAENVHQNHRLWAGEINGFATSENSRFLVIRTLDSEKIRDLRDEGHDVPFQPDFATEISTGTPTWLIKTQTHKDGFRTPLSPSEIKVYIFPKAARSRGGGVMIEQL